MSTTLFNKKHHLATLIAAVIASIAATTSAYFAIAPWIMFIGWVAYFTNPGTINKTLSNALCACLGVLLGIAAALSVSVLMPQLGAASFGPVVFIVAFGVVSCRALPIISNIPAWFLGVNTYFASHPEPKVGFILPIMLAITFGCFAGYIVQTLQIKLTK